MVSEWIIGVLLHPAETYKRAQSQLRLGYWWIVLCDMTIVAVATWFSPWPADLRGTATLTIILLQYLLFHVQAACFMGAAWAFQWRLSWRDSLKYVGLAWSVQLLEDIVLFYPALKDKQAVQLWLDIPFSIWFLVVLAFGVKRLSGLSAWKSILLTLMGALPWELVMIWQSWR